MRLPGVRPSSGPPSGAAAHGRDNFATFPRCTWCKAGYGCSPGEKRESLSQMPPPNAVPETGERIHVDGRLMQTLHDVGSRHYTRLATFVVLYLCAAYSASRLAQSLHLGAWTYLINLP